VSGWHAQDWSVSGSVAQLGVATAGVSGIWSSS
jgi:hypothetical protein